MTEIQAKKEILNIKLESIRIFLISHKKRFSLQHIKLINFKILELNRDKQEIPNIKKTKSQACPRMFWPGINLKLQITMNKIIATIKCLYLVLRLHINTRTRLTTLR